MSVSRLDTLFLGTCLLDGEDARASWTAWRAAIGQAPGGLDRARLLEKIYAPLLLRSATRHGLELDRDEVARLKARRLVESRRRERFLTILAEVLSILRAAHLDFLLVKGAALAESVYPDPVLRHAHDIDVLLPDADLVRARDALVGAGCRLSEVTSSSGHQALVHASRVPVMLHSLAFDRSDWQVPFDVFDAGAREVHVGGVAVRVPAPHHALLHVSVQGLAAGRSPAALRWVCDAWHLAPVLASADWDRLVRIAVDHRLAAPLALALTYLADALNVALPRSTLPALTDHARLHSLTTARDLVPRLQDAPRDLAQLLATDVGWPARFRIGWCLAMPSRSYMSHRPGAGPSPPGWAYVARAGRWLTGRASATGPGQGRGRRRTAARR